MKEVHKGEIFKICVHVRHGKIPQDKRIGLKPTGESANYNRGVPLSHYVEVYSSQ